MNHSVPQLPAKFRQWLAALSLGAALVTTATANVTLTATSPAGSSVLNPGASFAVDLTWSGTPAIAAADYTVTLNTNQIACTSRTFDGSLPYADTQYLSTFPVSTNTIDATWYKGTGFTGKDLTLNFQIPANYTGPATVTISLAIVGVQDAAAADIPSSVVTTTINIANTPPTISTVADQVITEDGATTALPFTVGDVESAAASLTLAGTSSNTTLVPNANIAFGGSGTNRTVTVTPAANQYGTSTITLTVNDGSSTTNSTFLLTVNPVNDPPTIANVADQTIYTNGATAALPVTIGDPETALTALVLTGSSDNQTLVPDANIALGGSGANRTVTVTPVAGQSGTATITLTVNDGTLTATDTFLLTVSATLPPVTGSASDTGTTARTVNWITNTVTNWLTWDSATIPGTGTSFDTANVTLTSSSTSGSYIIDFNQNLNLQNLNLTMKGTVDYQLGASTGTRRTINWNNNGTGTALLSFIHGSTANPLRNKYLVNSVLNTDLAVDLRFQGSKDGQFGGVVSGPGKLTINYAKNVNGSNGDGATDGIIIGTTGDALSTHTGGTSLKNSAGTPVTSNTFFVWRPAKANAFGTGMLELDAVRFSLNNFDQTVGGLGGGTGSSIILNGVAGTKTLTLDFPSSAGIRTYSGAIQTGTGEVALTKMGTGTQILSGTNTYLGATSITDGSLLVNGTLAAGSTVAVGANGTLGGTGTVSGSVNNSGTIAPGASVGTLTTGAVTMAADSKFEFEFSDWAGSTPGTSWDALTCTSLTLSGTSTNKIVIKLLPLSLANFSEATKTFTIATSAANITGFDANAISIDKSAMPGTGTWAPQVDATGKLLQLVYTAGTSKLPATVNLTGLTPTYDGNPKAASSTTVPSGLTVTYTYDGLATVPTNAGTYAVVATINDASYEGTASGSLVIGKATASVTLTGMTQTYDGFAKPVSSNTVPAGLTVTYTYDTSATAPTNAGSYAVVATVSDANYQGGAAGTLVILTQFASWQNAHFTQGQIDAGFAASDADPDHDGSNNMIEFAFNGDPLKGSNNGLFATERKDTTADGDANQELVLTCAVRRGTVFTAPAVQAQVSAAIDGIIYTVEGGTNLAGPWNGAISNVGASNTPPAGSGLPDLTGTDWEYRSFSGFNGLAGSGFLRAKVTSAP